MPIVTREQTIEQIKQTLSSKEINGQDKFELLKKVLSDPTIDKHVMLDLGIKYLNNLKNSKVINQYKSDSHDVMKKLHNTFQGDELYKPWVRYFDVTYKVKEELRGKDTLKIFKSNISELVQKLLFENGNSKMDWRIAKKMLAVSGDLFEKDTIDFFRN